MAMRRGSGKGKVPTVPGLRMERQFSVAEAEASSELLACIEDGDVEELHLLLSKLPEGTTSILNTPSLLARHKLRTPLMAAAATGDFPRFTAIQHAFDRQFPNKLQRDFEMRTQLTNRDREGMNIVMLAARSSSMAVLGALLTEIDQTEALTSLDMHDHKQMTVLMHSVSKGPAPIFQEVHRAMRKAFGGGDIEFGRHLLLKSADDKTILMHAAASGDPMVLKMVADACQRTIMPQKLRDMIVERDSDGLNLLMHAASCRAPPAALLPPEPLPEDGEAAGSIGASGSVSGGTAVPAATKDHHAGALKKASASGTSSSGGGTSTSTSSGAVDASGNTKSSLEQMISADEAGSKNDAEVVPVFKVAVRLVKQTLWKDEVLHQLKAIDLWGRSVLTHALLSGHEMMFEAAYGAVRDDVNDEQVSEMMETNEGEREDTPMIEALARGDTSMRKLYALRAGQVKKDVDTRSKLSSMDAKIESFIPGKLVVLFQLLLPQIAEGRQLFLLYVMCAIAPLMKLAAGSTDPDSKHPGIAPRSNKLSVLLGVPAMFFWGVGTSTVGSRLGWSSALSATSMAAATLVIPAVDSFFNSRQANRIGDKMCCKEWRFNWQAYRHWRRTRKSTPGKPPSSELPSYSTFAAEPETASSHGVEEAKQSAACSTCSTAAVATSPKQGLPRTTTPVLSPRVAAKDSFDLAEEEA